MDLETTGRRRRGQELEAAILGAAWEQLAGHGYANFTIDAVAQAAGTSRSVIYRRWPDRDTLLIASIEFGLSSNRPEIPDTGNLRDDVIAILTVANTYRAQQLPVMSALMGSYFAQDGMTFAKLRAKVMGGQSSNSMEAILQRALDRGEIDPERLTPRVRNVVFDLFRHDLLMTLSPLTEADITAIVDEVFLPLVGLGDHRST